MTNFHISFMEKNDTKKSAEVLNIAMLNNPHHLGPIGVLPTHQGSGIGSILMERFCKEVDACMSKAYSGLAKK